MAVAPRKQIRKKTPIEEKGAGAFTIHKKKKNYQELDLGEEESEQEVEIAASQVEANSFYHFHKVLSSVQYSVGKNVQEYLEAFCLQYRSIKESAALLPQPMEGVLLMINETVAAFYKDFNIGSTDKKSLMHRCRPAVERYLFSKLYDRLFAMYIERNEEDDSLFVERSAVLKRMRPEDIMKALDIKEKFIITEGLRFTSTRGSLNQFELARGSKAMNLSSS